MLSPKQEIQFDNKANGIVCEDISNSLLCHRARKSRKGMDISMKSFTFAREYFYSYFYYFT